MATDNPVLAAAKGGSSGSSPKAAGANPQLQAIEQQLAANRDRLQQSVVMAEEDAEATNVATNIIKQSLGQIASSTQIVAAATQNADLTAQNNANAVLAAAGGTEGQIAQMTRMKTQGDHINSLYDQKADIMDDEHTGLSIIDTVINGFRAIPVQRDLKVAARQYDATVTHTANMTAAQEGFSRVQQINKQAINESTIAANYKKISAEAALQGAEQDIRNVQHNSDAMTRILNADSRTVANSIEMYKMQGQAEQRALQEESIAFQRESMTNQREMWEFDKPRAAIQLEQAQLNLATAKDLSPLQKQDLTNRVTMYQKQMDDGLALERTTNTAVQVAQSSLGLPYQTTEQIQDGLSNPHTRDKYLKLVDIGTSPVARFGSNGYEAFSAMRTLDPDGRGQNSKGKKLLQHISNQQLAAYTDVGANPPKDEISYSSDFNKTADAVMKAAAKDIPAGDRTNPYQAPPMSIIESSAAVQNSELWQSVLSKTGLTEANPQLIMEQAAAGVLAKLVTPEQAATGIAEIFKAAVLYNNTEAGGFERVGLGAYSQTSYNTTIEYKPTFTDALKGANFSIGINPALQAGWQLAGNDPKRAEKVNMIDEAQVQQMIVRQLSSSPKIKENPNQ